MSIVCLFLLFVERCTPFDYVGLAPLKKCTGYPPTYRILAHGILQITRWIAENEGFLSNAGTLRQTPHRPFIGQAPCSSQRLPSVSQPIHEIGTLCLKRGGGLLSSADHLLRALAQFARRFLDLLSEIAPDLSRFGCGLLCRLLQLFSLRKDIS